jgi:cohesin complex subunit SA-1/2
MLHANPQICHYAYSTLCDLLISMSPHLVDKNPDYQVLVIEINENLIQSLLTFLNTYVFFAEEPKSKQIKKFLSISLFFLLLDQDEQGKIETLHKKRNLLAAYCKLIVHNVLPIQAATNILKYYVKVK